VAGTGKKWLIGCGVGCAATSLLAIIITIGGGLLLTRPFGKAVDAQKALTSEFGSRESYEPGPGGIAPDRMEAFLAVRRALLPSCAEFEKIGASFEAMEELDKDGDEPSTGEMLKGVGNVMGSVFGIAGEIGKVTQRRNEALLEQEMGLGEYTWIYVLAYNVWLANAPNTEFSGDAGHPYQGQELKTVRRLLENYTEALRRAGMMEQAEIWSREAARLDRVDSGVPFTDGELPGEFIDSFAPYRRQLEKTYCPAMAAFDLGRVQKKGFSYHSD